MASWHQVLLGLTQTANTSSEFAEGQHIHQKSGATDESRPDLSGGDDDTTEVEPDQGNGMSAEWIGARSMAYQVQFCRTSYHNCDQEQI